MVKKRINGEGTVWYVASEKRYRAQYPVGGKRLTRQRFVGVDVQKITLIW